MISMDTYDALYILLDVLIESGMSYEDAFEQAWQMEYELLGDTE